MLITHPEQPVRVKDLKNDDQFFPLGINDTIITVDYFTNVGNAEIF